MSRISTIVAALLLLCLSAIQATHSIEEQNRELYRKASWFDRINTPEKHDLKKCERRNVAPTEGESCSMRHKLCYFDTQYCGNIEHPSTKCDCSGSDASKQISGTWSCVYENCPALCPAEMSPDAICTQDGITCHYGVDHCCGTKSPESSCSCVDGKFVCFFADACLLPGCLFENWDDLVGIDCDFAASVIKDDFPGMVVECVTEEVETGQDNYDRNRMFLLVDNEDIVIVAPKVG